MPRKKPEKLDLPCPAAANGCQTHTQYWFVRPTNQKWEILSSVEKVVFQRQKLTLIFYVHKNTDRMSKAASARLILYCEQGECFSFWESAELHDQKTKNWAEAQKTEKTDSADTHAFSILCNVYVCIFYILLDSTVYDKTPFEPIFFDRCIKV